MTDIGGFFTSLGMRVDTGSFAKGQAAVTNTTKSLIGMRGEFKLSAQEILKQTGLIAAGFLALGTAMAGMGTSFGKKSAAALMGAFDAGMMRPMAYKNWLTAVEMTGVNPDAFGAMLSELNKMQQDLALGKSGPLTEAARPYAQITGKDFLTVLRQDPEERLQTLTTDLEKVFRSGNTNQILAISNAFRAMGLDALVDAVAGASQGGKSLSALVGTATGAAMVTEADVRRGAAVSVEQGISTANVQGVLDLLAAEINKSLLPAMRDFNKWFTDPANKAGLQRFAEMVGKAAEVLFGLASKLGMFVFGDQATLEGRARVSALDQLTGQGFDPSKDPTLKRWMSPINIPIKPKLSDQAMDWLLYNVINPNDVRVPGAIASAGPLQSRLGYQNDSTVADRMNELLVDLNTENVTRVMSMTQVSNSGTIGDGASRVYVFDLKIGGVDLGSITVDAATGEAVMRDKVVSDSEKRQLLEAWAGTQ